MAKKIALVVDDDQFMDNLVNQTLMMNGYNTVVCSNFKHALKSYNKFQIHLVVTDIFMPRMGGIEGIRRLKSGDHGKPYYRNVEGRGWHGMSTADTVASAQKIGTDAHLQKPFAPRDLKQLVESLVSEFGSTAFKFVARSPRRLAFAPPCLARHGRIQQPSLS